MIGFQETQAAPNVVLIEGQARLSAVPAEAHIGEPVVWTLSVEHSSGDGLPESLSAPLKEQDGWVLVAGPDFASHIQPDGAVLSEAKWTYFSLRPGARMPAEYALTLKRGAPLSVEIQPLQVLGELQEGEEAPRPMAPMRPIEASPTGNGALCIGIGLLLILALLVWRKTRGRKSNATEASAPPVWEALKQASLPEDAGAARQTLFDWHRDIRLGVDRALGQERGALIDADWLAQCRASAGARVFPWADLERALEELERLKYQQPMPGRLTLQGVEESVRVLATALHVAELAPPVSQREEPAA